MSTPNGISALKSWYESQIKDHKENAIAATSTILKNVRFYFWFYLVVLVISLLILLAMALSSGSISEVHLPIVCFALLNFTILVFFIYVLSKIKMNSFDDLRREGIIKPFDNPKGLELDHMLIDLADNMLLDYNRIKVWKIFSRQAYPSIEVSPTGDINLLIPPAFVARLKTEPGKTKAILAHELGHVLQSDYQLFSTAEAYYTVIKNYFLPLLIISIIIETPIVILFFFVNGNILTTLGLFFNIFMVRSVLKGLRNVKELRIESEILADAAAIVYTGRTDIISVLNDLPDRKSTHHPGKKIRYERASKFINEFSIA